MSEEELFGTLWQSQEEREDEEQSCKPKKKKSKSKKLKRERKSCRRCLWQDDCGFWMKLRALGGGCPRFIRRYDREFGPLLRQDK